ncbi:MAG: indole-3-glycerol phosphate synthase TrpC [Prevotella sp.]|nr:indole-3-glycerol phosphate synthase TrpC [Prevotella sp.]
MDILDEIVANKRIEVERFKAEMPFSVLEKKVEAMLDVPVPSMSKALMTSDSGIISEFKRKSPSKGWIKEEGRAEIIPLSYQQNGASALSILTDTKYFGGDDSFIVEARKSGVTIPILYKNFVIDEYQLYQARLCGASAVLLIAADLSLKECKSLMDKAHSLGLEVLLEMHSESELEYADLGPDMCGINNRNLGTFITKVENSFRLAELLPKDICKVSESGISNPDTVRELRQAGFNGFLIGENFMKTPDPGDSLKEFVSRITNY